MVRCMKYDYRSELDKGMQYYDDKIIIAEQHGYADVHGAVKGLWEAGEFTQKQIGDMFKVSPTTIQIMLRNAKTTRRIGRGGRNARANRQGVFIHSGTTHQFTAGYVKDDEEWENVKYQIIRCTECSEILSSGVWLSRREVFNIADAHRKICNYDELKRKTNHPYKNGRGIFNSNNFRVIAGYAENNRFKLIRCIRCNEILSDNEWIDYYKAWELIREHKLNHWKRERILRWSNT